VKYVPQKFAYVAEIFALVKNLIAWFSSNVVKNSMLFGREVIFGWGFWKI
jgi:hypothetical protein